MASNPLSLPAYHEGYMADLPGGKQHWSFSGTLFERKSGSESALTDVDLDGCTELILSDAEAAFRRWQDLCRSHVTCAIDYPLWGLTQAFVMELKAECDRLSVGTSVTDMFPRLVRLGVWEFYEDIVCRVDFFKDAPMLVTNIVEAIIWTVTCVIYRAHRGLSMPGMTDAVNRVVATVCRVTWELREQFLSRNATQDAASGCLRTVSCQLRRLLKAYCAHNIPRMEDRSLLHPGHEHIRRMALFLWFHRSLKEEEPSLDCAPFGDDNILFWVDATVQLLHPGSPEIGEIVVDIIAEYGALNFLARLSDWLRSPSSNDRDADTARGLIQRVLLRAEFLPYLASSGLLEQMRLAITRFQEEDAEQNIIRAMDTLGIFHKVATNVPVPDGRALLIRQCDVVGLLSQTMLYILRVDYQLAEEYCAYIDDYTAFARVLCERHGKNNVLRKSLTQSAQYHWLDTLQRLRWWGASNDTMLNGKHLLLERSWVLFGGALGLDEDEEADRRERENRRDIAQFCAWKECQYHKAKAPTPPNACKGCGEVRYCGKECQRLDWKAGHKRVCKRIKDEAHTPKV
ncbi:hypothetical protein PENSPDRAFT_758176 [Peniophora sp. CONT]|nr:hypothetical protein PENSPDRAFT_758176 [Peniophora sp. CONT]